MQPEPSAPVVEPDTPQQPIEKTVQTKSAPRQRHYLAVFFLSFMWGMFGVDRMYLGKWGTGILKLITFGGFGLWVLIDLVLIMGGAMRDKQGQAMLQFAEYKKFTYWTVLLFAIALGVVMLVTGAALIFSVTQLMTSLQNGGSGGIPGLDSLLNGGPSGIPPELQEYL